ncbi:DUF4293 domain-containing protein [Schleiferiaceae bacterium]|nr:DUF4293 domain-containing protein [Schleiferiaceae bacterium]
MLDQLLSLHDNNSEIWRLNENWRSIFFNFVARNFYPMIQRIQTLYLFGAAIISTLGAFILPLYATESEVFRATAGMYTFLTFGISMSLFSGAVLLYRNRKMQLVVVRLGMLSALAAMGFIIQAILTNTGAQASWGAAAPFVCILFAFLASKGIRNDEKKIRSLDRLR